MSYVRFRASSEITGAAKYGRSRTGCSGIRLQVPGRVHALMQDTDDGDAVTGRPEIDDVLLDVTPPIAWSNIGTALRLVRRFGQIGAGSFDKVDIAHCLRDAPMRHNIVEHSVGIALRRQAERHSAMLRGFAPLERGKIERLGLPALLALDQRLTDALTLEATLLLAPDEVADRLAVIGVVAGVDLDGDPPISQQHAQGCARSAIAQTWPSGSELPQPGTRPSFISPERITCDRAGQSDPLIVPS